MCHTYRKQQSKIRLCFPLGSKTDWLIDWLIDWFLPSWFVYYRHQYDQNDHRFRFFLCYSRAVEPNTRCGSLNTIFPGDVRVASRGQESISVASQGVCFMCISCVPSCQSCGWGNVSVSSQGLCCMYRDTTKPLVKTGKRSRKGHTHTRAHARTHKSKDTTQRLSFRYFRRPRSLKCIAFRNLFHMLWKLL